MQACHAGANGSMLQLEENLTMVERIGETLVRIGAMTEEQVSDILARQKNGDARMFGEIAIELSYIDDEVMASYLEMHREKPG